MRKVPSSPKGQKERVADLRRGEVYHGSFNPAVGHEIKKTQPALIIQSDIGNRYGPLTIVAAITPSISRVPYPVEVLLEPTTDNGLAVRSSLRLDQIRTLDR